MFPSFSALVVATYNNKLQKKLCDYYVSKKTLILIYYLHGKKMDKQMLRAVLQSCNFHNVGKEKTSI